MRSKAKRAKVRNWLAPTVIVAIFSGILIPMFLPEIRQGLGLEKTSSLVAENNATGSPVAGNHNVSIFGDATQINQLSEGLSRASTPTAAPVDAASQHKIRNRSRAAIASQPVTGAPCAKEWIGINIAGEMSNSSISGVHMKGLPDCATAIKVQKMKNGSHIDGVEMENQKQ